MVNVTMVFASAIGLTAAAIGLIAFGLPWWAAISLYLLPGPAIVIALVLRSLPRKPPSEGDHIAVTLSAQPA
ncbi:hypothetical protein ACXN5S_11435 [Pseudoroseicyclus sp. H15]